MIDLNLKLNELFSSPKLPMLFLDFDGTISRRDVIDAILEEFADERWLAVEDEWLTGKIGSRECLQKQFGFVKATPEELNELLDSIELDEGWPDLLDFCQKTGVKTHIISDGFGYYIKRHLDRQSARFPGFVENIRVWANDLVSNDAQGWTTEFPYFPEICSDGCATCKPEVMKLTNNFNVPTIFVGDGLSDRFAAKSADLVFAKKKLAEFCAEHKIGFSEYENLAQVAHCLDEAFESTAIEFCESERTPLLKAA